jgi:hypothetical protein
MKRDYDDGVRNGIDFFVGKEVEKTPTEGLKTLFVVGKQSLQEIVNLAKENQCQHIYLGANHSFKALSDFDQVIILNTAKSLLDKEYWVTIDIPQSLKISGLQTLLTNPKFSLIYSVTVGDIMKMKGNVVIKIDDKDFKATNPGVWCWSVRDLITDEHFTDWEQYKGDTVL